MHEAARWDLPPEPAAKPERQDERVVEAIRHAREGRNFRGRDAVLCLGAGNLFVQNIRVAQATGDELTKIVHFEAAGRLPFASEEAEIRYLEADDVKQGDTVRREVVLLACHRPALERMLSVAEQAGLRPVAIDVEPAAMLRCYCRQFRRDDDQQRRMMFVNIGASNTVVVIARGPDTMFVKYIDIGGRHFDEAVARHLKMTPADAAALRRHNGDRRGGQRDPEIARGIDESVRPVLDKLAHELSLCLRYYSVTFRGQPLSQIVLGGGEATDALARVAGGAVGPALRGGQPVAALREGHRRRPPRTMGRGRRIGLEAIELTCTTSTSYPSSIARNTQQRQSQPWQIVAAVAIVGLVAAAALTQNHRRRSVQDELAIITPAYEAAVNQQNRLADVQARLKAAKAGAELYTYLRHPWPRTQLLTALVAPLPKEITLQQVQILREAPTAAPPAEVRPPVDKKTEEEKLKSLPPAERDLAKLRARLDPLQTVVILAGTATESRRAAPLHRRLGRHGHLRQGGTGLLQQHRQQQRRRGAPVPRRAGRPTGLRPAGRPHRPRQERRGTEPTVQAKP